MTFVSHRARPAVAAVLLLAAAGPAAAEKFSYRDDDTECVGFLATPKDAAGGGKLPGVLVVPEWWGCNEFAQERAKELAAAGFVALAVDMYGGGRTTTQFGEAARLSGAVKKDPVLLRRRMNAALTALIGTGKVDPAKVVAMGYCFGGTCSLELARAGVPIAGAVSFHGGLGALGGRAAAGALKAKVLVLHGAADPFVKPAEVAAFEREMADAGADFQLVKFGGAVHSFTNPQAGSDPGKGMAYDATTTARANRLFRLFLKDVTGGGEK